MTPHISAQKDDYAPVVLLPGDPLRAKWIAETFLNDIRQVNDVRGMLGFTGTYKGKPVSVQGTGMGMPSCSIYCHELIEFYGVKSLIRVGTCGGMQESLKVRDLILGLSASTDSAMNHVRFKGMDFAPHASYRLVAAAAEAAKAAKLDLKIGGIVSSDQFYADAPDHLGKFIEYGVLAVEMEANAIYSLAAKFGVDALAICAVSDNIITGEQISATERQASLNEMITLALETAISE